MSGKQKKERKGRPPSKDGGRFLARSLEKYRSHGTMIGEDRIIRTIASNDGSLQDVSGEIGAAFERAAPAAWKAADAGSVFAFWALTGLTGE